MGTILEVRDLKTYFYTPESITRAADGISYDVREAETVALVGESGSGKTTVGLSILQLYKPTAGEVIYQDKDLCRMKGEELRRTRRKMQMIFQDTYGSLNPRMTAADVISEPLAIHRILPRKQRMGRVLELLSAER